jgi:hypothetical protein
MIAPVWEELGLGVAVGVAPRLVVKLREAVKSEEAVFNVDDAVFVVEPDGKDEVVVGEKPVTMMGAPATDPLYLKWVSEQRDWVLQADGRILDTLKKQSTIRGCTVLSNMGDS